MLVLPKEEIQKLQNEAREGMVKHFNDQLEKILNARSKKEKYWILGKISTEHVNGKLLVKPFLEACDEKPGLVKDSFVYEVDNTRGTKTLLWVLHPDGSMRLPTLNKTIYPQASPA